MACLLAAFPFVGQELASCLGIHVSVMALMQPQNYLGTGAFEGGEWIACSIHISRASWIWLREELEEFRRYWREAGRA